MTARHLSSTRVPITYLSKRTLGLRGTSLVRSNALMDWDMIELLFVRLILKRFIITGFAVKSEGCLIYSRIIDLFLT